jgi:hypothetical protein
MCKNGRIFEAKQRQIEANKGPKTAFNLASKQGSGAEKTLPGEPNGEARQASNSTLRRLETGRGRRLAPRQAAGAVNRNEVLEALDNRASWLRGEMTVNCAFFPVNAICAFQECQTPHLLRDGFGACPLSLPVDPAGLQLNSLKSFVRRTPFAAPKLAEKLQYGT